MIRCPNCGEAAEPDAMFCEACGSPLNGAAAAPTLVPAEASVKAEVPAKTEPPAKLAARVCASCGGRIADDGYCEQCGKPAQSERDHWAEEPASWVAGVCDRGIQHAINEDAMALSADATPGAFAALVVCDGVSSTPGSDIASLAAAKAARDTLVAARTKGFGTDHDASLAHWSEAMLAAGVAAGSAIDAAIGDLALDDNPPSCTFAAAVIDGPLVLVGCVGDSRVYWIPDEGTARQLSTDDSWAQEMIAQGMSRQQAESAPQAHSITRWLGADSTDEIPHLVPTFPASPGWVLVCSDGLWNYCSEATKLGALLRETAATVGAAPSALSHALVEWANAQGGHDNVTVALARLEGSALDTVVSTESVRTVPTPHPGA